jgi:tripartite-type tricarboxylate transporter receptor subunit TctC
MAPAHILAGELFKRVAGIELTHVPYRGAAPALQDLVPGRVDSFFNIIAPVHTADAAGPATCARHNVRQANAGSTGLADIG